MFQEGGAEPKLHEESKEKHPNLLKFKQLLKHHNSEVGRLYDELAQQVGVLLDLQFLKEKCKLSSQYDALYRLEKKFNDFAKENPGLLLVKTTDPNDKRKTFIGLVFTKIFLPKSVESLKSDKSDLEQELRKLNTTRQKIFKTIEENDAEEK